MKKIYYLSTVFLTLLLIGATVSTTAQTLIQPTSTGIVWVQGTTHNITWSGDPSTSYKLYYKKNGAGTPIDISVSGNSYSWDIPADFPLGADYTITLYYQTGLVASESLNFFEIDDEFPPGDGEIHVEQPNVLGIQWEPGTQHGIYWTDNLVEPVRLELWWNNNGTDEIYPGSPSTTGLPTSVEGTGYIWTIPAVFPVTINEYKIKVRSTTTDVFDFGENYFAITDQFFGGTEIELIQPDVADLQWESGTTHLISWMDDLIENVDLELYIETSAGSGNYVPYSGSPASNLPTNNVGTTVDWDIPVLPNGNYKIYAVSSAQPTIDDISEFPFAVTDTPSGGETITLIQPNDDNIQWLFEETYVISWMDDLIEPVIIELFNSAGYLTTLKSGATGTTWDWHIPAEGVNGIDDDDDYKIKIISSATPPTAYVKSANTFEITTIPHSGETIEVIQPDIDGIEWEIGTEHLISWMDDLIEPVNIELYTSPADVLVGEGVSGIPDADYNGTTWTWEIPDDQGLEGGSYKIKISSSASGSSATPAISEYAFDIIDYSPYGEVIIIQPNGGEEWIKGNSYLISWTDNISENVNIEVTDGTNGWKTITPDGGVPSSTWTWNTETNWPTTFDPILYTETYEVRISSVNTSSSATDISEDPFSFVQTIGGLVWVNQPNGGEVWVDETSHLISWDDELVENVYVKLLKGGDDPIADLVPWELTGLPANAYSGIGIPGTTLTWDIPETNDCGDGEDFDALAQNDFVAQELGGYWTIWNGDPGTAKDAKVTNTYSVSPDNSFRVEKSTALVLKFADANLTSGSYTFTNDILISTAETGYWSLQKSITTGNDCGFRIKYGNNMMTIDAGGLNAATVSYLNNTWYHNEIVVNLDNDWCDFYVDGEHIIGFQWSLDFNGDPGENELVGVLFWGENKDNAGSYFDNVCFSGSGSGLYSGTNYKIAIESIYDPQYNDISEGTFTIATEQTGGTTISINQPNGGEIWELNTEHLISWDDDVFEDVNIDLVDANEVLIASIATNVESTTHVWDIDDATFGVGTYKVRVYSPVTPSLEDYSNAIFTITGTKEGQSNFALGSGNGELVIYPNPTSTQFTIVTPGSSIDKVVLRNMLGQVLYTSTVEAGQTVIDVSSYDAGIYIVNIIVEGEVVTKKLFVQ